MTPSSPPSFDTLFDNQQNGRESPGNSTTDYNQYGYPRPPFNTTHPHQLGGDFPLTDEPPPLSRHGSHDGHLRGRTESHADRVKGVSMNDGRGGPFKQDSLQFDFESSSTLIATAPRGSNRPSPGQNDNGHSDNIGETVFAPSPQHASFSADGQYQFRNQQWDMAGNDGYGQYAGLRQDMANPANPFPSNEAPFSGMGLQEPHPSNSGDNSFLYNQHSQFPAAVVTPNQPIDGAWSHDFLGQGNGAASLGGGQERRMSGASWSSGNGMDHVLSVDDQEQLHELERM